MRCSFCTEEAVIYKKRDKKAFCRYHFLESVEERIQRTIYNNNLIDSGDKVAVAFSGGKDSAVTLYILNKILMQRRDFELTAIIVNEGIKGYREESIRKAGHFCTNLGIDLYTVDLKKQFGKSVDEISKRIDKKYVCAYCGELREYLLYRAAFKLKATKLAMCFNQDDVVRLLLNFYRFSDIIRLSSVCAEYPPQQISFSPRYIVPIRQIPQKEVALYAYLKKLEIDDGDCPYNEHIEKNHWYRDCADMLYTFEDKYGFKSDLLNTFDEVVSPLVNDSVIKRNSLKRRCQVCGGPMSIKNKFILGLVCKNCMQKVGINHENMRH